MQGRQNTKVPCDKLRAGSPLGLKALARDDKTLWGTGSGAGCRLHCFFFAGQLIEVLGKMMEAGSLGEAPILVVP
jgi:hypothetical protein